LNNLVVPSFGGDGGDERRVHGYLLVAGPQGAVRQYPDSP
jgi:hypothetical protein